MLIRSYTDVLGSLIVGEAYSKKYSRHSDLFLPYTRRQAAGPVLIVEARYGADQQVLNAWRVSLLFLASTRGKPIENPVAADGRCRADDVPTFRRLRRGSG